MERRRRPGWTGGPRPQHASARGCFQTCGITTGILSHGSLSASRDYNCAEISPLTGTISTSVSAFRNAFSAFLPGSAQQVEFAVTHSKQSTAAFLPGSRIAFWRTITSTQTTQKLGRMKLRKRCVTRGLNTFLTETALHSKTAVTHSKQSAGTFLTGARTASLADIKSSNIDGKLSEERAWLRL
jgi:hypothetical protein